MPPGRFLAIDLANRSTGADTVFYTVYEYEHSGNISSSDIKFRLRWPNVRFGKPTTYAEICRRWWAYINGRITMPQPNPLKILARAVNCIKRRFSIHQPVWSRRRWRSIA